jgi:hypothetical protein
LRSPFLTVDALEIHDAQQPASVPSSVPSGLEDDGVPIISVSNADPHDWQREDRKQVIVRLRKRAISSYLPLM